MGIGHSLPDWHEAFLLEHRRRHVLGVDASTAIDRPADRATQADGHAGGRIQGASGSAERAEPTYLSS